MTIIRASNTAVRTASYLHVQQLLLGVPLACLEARVEQIITAVGPRMVGLATDGAVELRADLFSEPPPEPDEIAVDEFGVAVVPIRGTFTRRAGAMDALSGLASYEQTAKLMQAVVARDDVRGIVQAYDSPGGAVTGMLDAAATFRALRDKKPIYGAVDGMAASAAYCLIAQTERIFIGQSDLAGSVGVFAVRLDATAADRAAGLKYDFVRHGDRKGDGDPHNPVSSAELADLQRRVDESAALMFDTIVAARGAKTLSRKALTAQNAAVFMGQGAVEAGLADEVGGVAEAVRAMGARLGDRRSFAAVPTQFGALAHETAPTLSTDTSTAQHAKETDAMADTTTEKTTPETPAPAPAVPAATATPPAPVAASNVIPLDVATRQTAEALAAREQETVEIVALCTHFGCAARATEFLQAKKTRAEVFAVLQAEVVAKDQAQPTRSAFGPSATPSEAKVTTLAPEAYDKNWTDAIAAAHTARATPIIG